MKGAAMESEGLGSVKISGSGTAGGGTYDEVSISGSGKVTGDIEAKHVRVSGSGRFQGCVKADSLKGSGAFEIDKDVDAKEFECSGAGKVGGNLKADELKASGALRIGGGAKVVNAHISGAVNVAGDLEGEYVRSSGDIHVGGLLSADKVEIALGGHSEVKEIGGERITVVGRRKSGGFFQFGWLFGTGSLDAETVEGDDVHLDGTMAKVVRGRRVKIGHGCRIERVEYGQSLQIDPDAQVGETGFTGEGEPTAVDLSPVQPPEGGPVCRSGQICLNGADIRNPGLKLLAVVFGLGIAALAVVFAMLVAGVTVGLTLGGVGLLLIVLAGGIPLLVIGSLILSLIMIPIHAIASLFRRRPYC